MAQWLQHPAVCEGGPSQERTRCSWLLNTPGKYKRIFKFKVYNQFLIIHQSNQVGWAAVFFHRSIWPTEWRVSLLLSSVPLFIQQIFEYLLCVSTVLDVRDIETDNKRQYVCSDGAYSAAFTGTQLKILDIHPRCFFPVFLTPEVTFPPLVWHGLSHSSILSRRVSV